MTTHTDMVIVGRGIMGSVLARKALACNRSIHLSGGKPLASLAAMGVMRPSWLHDPWRKRFDDALAWYKNHGWLIEERALISTWKDLKPRFDSDWYVVDNQAPLLAASEEPEPATTDLRVYAHPLPGSKFTWGHTLYAAVDRPLHRGLRVHMYAPYRHLFVYSTPDYIRVGASQADTESISKQRMRVLLQKAEQMGLVPFGIDWEWKEGIRAFLPSGPTLTWEQTITGRRVLVGGLGRVGFSLAPIFADEILSRMT